MAPEAPSITVTHNSPSDYARPIKPAGADAMTMTDGREASEPDVPLVTDGQGTAEFKTPLVKRKGSAAGIQGADPLTAHILQRTGTAQDLNLNSPSAIGHGDALGSGSPKPSESNKRGGDGNSVNSSKDKKKMVSFLSRFIGGSRKKSLRNDFDDEESTEGDLRTEGMDAHVFSQPIGYTPQYPPPPKYIRVRSHHKSRREFNNIFLAQELYREPIYEGENGRGSNAATSATSLAIPRHKSGAIWAMKFSKDGKYLAAGGQDKVVRVWQVIGTAEERSAHETEEDAFGSAMGGVYTQGAGMRLNAPVFRNEPVQEYAGHTADILDLSWSKNQFLLSSSMDKTVRLWHVTKKECLCCFQHSDFVTSIVFHPIDDRFFLAGSLDSKLRLWSIPDKSVAFWNEVPDLITAVAFTPDGRMAIAGCSTGLCLFYETEGLRYNTQVLVRSTLGRNAKGSKITGIETTYLPPEDTNGEVKILITSNDSRVRLYNLRDKSLETKFKGYVNTCSQIRATFSDDVKYIASGSEDRKVYIWSAAPEDGEKKAKLPVEYFEASSSIVTVAILAPTKTRLLLGSSRDPVYDLCYPPPVYLGGGSDTSSVADSPKVRAASNALPQVPEDQASISPRALHSDGHIIVTADSTGRIKVFRQDCAHLKRKNEQWENGSTFSRKLGVGRRSSLNQNNNWRSSIGSDVSGRSSLGGLGIDESSRNRSVSPRKSMGGMSLNIGGSPRGTRSRAQSLSSNKGGSIAGVSVGNGSANGHSHTGSLASTANSIPRRPEVPMYNTKTRDTHSTVSSTVDNSVGDRWNRVGNAGQSTDTSVQEGYSSEESDNVDCMSCHRCGSTVFLAKKMKGSSQTKLQCAK
ncbi:WD40-repeat-containing domain protein [Kalaharituber pfeilii]|nr:WD40-repeat-containing domain protein [Kalaharituber pfeilii]